MLSGHYENLMALCDDDTTSFYYKDHQMEDATYRIFNYRLASYSDFTRPDARECRGHMYRIENDGSAELVALPPPKFFNKDENPFTQNLDFSDCDLILDKLDGSLVTTFLHGGDLRLKSKGSLRSDQALAAMELIYSDSYTPLRDFCTLLAKNSWSISMEYTAPTNRIVVPHQSPELTVLCARNLETGDTMSHTALQALMQEYGCPRNIVTNHAEFIEDHAAFVDTIHPMTDMEGYVIRIRDGETVKIKTDWYRNLHALIDTLNSPRNLFNLVVNEQHDDARSLFHYDEWRMIQIAEMETLVRGLYRDIRVNVDNFYKEYKHLDRKSYAILAKKEVKPPFFSLAMSAYIGRDMDYKEFLIKNYKYWGIIDKENEE